MSWFKKLIGGDASPPPAAPASPPAPAADPLSQATRSRWERVQGAGGEVEITMEVIDGDELRYNAVCFSIHGRFHPVSKRETFGRDGSCHVVITGDREISREHLQVEALPEEGVRIMDLETVNGTYVNGNPVRKRAWTRVSDGDRVSLGSRIHFQVHVRKG